MNLPLSLIGRCHFIKMVSFSRLLYLLQTLPCLLTQKDVHQVNKSFSAFIWQGKRPQISNTKLCRPKSEGLQFPDLRLYNLACLLSLLRRALDWINGKLVLFEHQART